MSSFDKNILYKRNIILIPADFDGVSNQKGILAVEQKENGVICTLKCFNLKPTDEKYTIGITVGGKSFKKQATAKEMSNLKLQINEIKSIASKVSCVIVSLTKKSYETLLWGSTETTKAMAESYFIENLLQETKILENESENLDKNNYQFEQVNNVVLNNIKNSSHTYNNEQNENNDQRDVGFNETNSHILNTVLNQDKSNSEFNIQGNETIDENGFNVISQPDEKLIINQKQEDVFEEEMLTDYIDKVIRQTENNEQQNQNNQTNKSFINLDKSTKTSNFYDQVYDQVQDLFLHNQAELVLEKIIPESKFCKVPNGDEYYVFGVIYQQGEVKCICYGIPSDYSVVPPKEVDGYCQWLPLDANNYRGKGYWLTYQDAVTGENISVEII